MRVFIPFILFITLFCCQKSQNKPVEVQNNPPSTILENVKQVSMVLDVEKLIGLNIEQMKNVLGKPFSEFIPTSEQKRLDITPSVEWYFDELGIYLDYRNNDKIMYIFVLNGGNYGDKYSTNDLMNLANLKYNSDHYSVKPQRAMNGSGITGIHVYGK